MSNDASAKTDDTWTALWPQFDITIKILNDTEQENYMDALQEAMRDEPSEMPSEWESSDFERG